MGIRMTNIATPMPQLRAKFTSKLGIPLSGCKVYTYEPNSDIPKTTWIDIDKTTENTNPILLDAAGEADIYLDGLYRIVVKDRFGFVIYDVEKAGTHTEWDASFVVDGDKNQKQINENQRAINSRTVTPYDFGAIGDGSSHKLSERYATLAQAKAIYPHAVSLDDEIDWCAAQAACIESMKSYKDVYGRELDLSGYFCINRPILYVTKAQTNDQYHVGEHRTFKADLRFNIADVFTGDCVILLHGRGLKHVGSIRGDLQKKVKYGIVVSDRYTAGNSNYINMGIELDRVFIDGAKIHNVYFRENSMFSVLNFYRGGSAGAGDLSNRVVTTITSRSMTTGTFEQRSHLTVVALPEFTLAELENRLYVRVGKYLSRVKSITGNTLNVYPIIPDNELSSELQYIYGCGVKISGSDSAGLKVGEITDIGSGIGFHNDSMYPAVVTKLVTEFTGIAHLTTGLVGGTTILSQYFEGDLFQHIQDTEGFGLSGTSTVLSSTAAEIPRFDNLFCPRNLDGTPYVLYGGMRGMTFNEGSITHKVADGKYPQNFLANGPSNGRGVNFNIPHQVTSYYAPANFYIDFHPINAASNNTFCYDSQEYILSGNGANGAPLGLITVRPLDGYTLNGGTSALEFYGFKSACHLHFMLDVVNKNIIVSLMSESLPRVGTTAQRPSNPQRGMRYYDTTLLPAGKPIEWNGSNWIDMTGTIV